MIIVLKPGECIEVQFHECDGSIVTRFDHDAVRVSTDWPDSSDRVGTIYEEKFVNTFPDLKTLAT